MSTPTAIQWLGAPEEQDFPSAASYLSLLFDPDECSRLVGKLRSQGTTTPFKAKDIFRASRLSLLGVSNLHVEKDSQKIGAGKGLSPLLLVRDPKNSQVIIADGYHRLCAVYAIDEDAIIPCRIA